MPENRAGGAAAIADDGIGKTRILSVGTSLHEARERLGLSVADVSSSIKFASRQIEALEADDFAHLPEATFLRGFVRSYAKLLHLDPEKLLAALPQVEKKAAPVEAKTLNAVPFPTVYSERKPNIIWLMAALVVAVILGLSAWKMSRSLNKPDMQNKPGVSATGNTIIRSTQLPQPVPVSAIAATPEPAFPASPPQSPANSAPGMIRLVFDKDSWAEVTDRHGKLLLSKINPQGTEQNLNGSPPFSLVIGEAKGVHLYYKGKLVDLAPYIKIEVARLTLE